MRSSPIFDRRELSNSNLEDGLEMGVDVRSGNYRKENQLGVDRIIRTMLVVSQIPSQ